MSKETTERERDLVRRKAKRNAVHRLIAANYEQFQTLYREEFKAGMARAGIVR